MCLFSKRSSLISVYLQQCTYVPIAGIVAVQTDGCGVVGTRQFFL